MLRLVALFSVCFCILAQSDRGTITGRVLDPSGAAVMDAAVTATNQGTKIKFSGTSNPAGNYSIQQLPVGRYEVTAEASGFHKVIQANVDINVAQTVTLNFNLPIGDVTQAVEVRSAPELVESSTSDVGTVVTQKQVIDLPLAVSGNMRNPESFIFLTPGVSGDTGNTQINGSQSRAKEILVDGIGAASPESGGLLFTYPSVEAISEFKLLGSNFNAEYGRTGGGFEIFTTRSGSNQFHGSAFDYLRNNVFDARGFFARTTPVNRQNEFGASLGGPIIRNRTFFYALYSGFRYSAGTTNELLTLPTAEMRLGDFSRLVDKNGNRIVIYDPATTRLVNGVYVREPFPGNVVPAERFSTVARKILPLIPQPTYSTLTNNFLTIGAQHFNRDQVDVKIDHNFSDRNRLSGFVYIGRQHSIAPQRLPLPLTNALDESRPSRWVRLNHDFIFSPSTLNHFSAGFTREPQLWRKLSADQGWPGKLGLTGVNTGPGNTFPRILFGDYAAFGDDTKTVGAQVNNAWEYTDSVSHVHGSHSFKLGADVRWLQTNGADLNNSQGTFTFGPLETALPNTRAGGNSFASFLLGAVDSASYKQLLVVPANRYRYFAAFAQDDWKATRKLTLNYGLRYDIFFPRVERFGNMSGFDPGLPNPGAGGRLGAVAFLGSGPGRLGRRSFADTDYKNFGPRFGFAYSLTSRTVLRGGYGIYYAPGNAASGLRSSQNFSYGFNPVPSYASTDAGVTPAFNLDQGFPTNYPPAVITPTVQNGANVTMIGRHDGRAPYFQNWTFGFQQELPYGILAEADYVAVKGTRLGNNLISLNELDPKYLDLGNLLTQQVGSPAAQAAGIAIPYPGFKGTVAQALRPYPQYLAVTDLSNPNGNSTYHALQTKLQKRLSHGVTFLAAYTFSRTLSDSDIQAGGGPGGQTYYNRRLEKGLSTNDVPHIFAADFVWDLPGRGRLLGGWTLTGIEQYQTGRPVTITQNDTLPLFNSLQRPNVVAGVKRAADHSHFDPATRLWINPAAFSVAGPLAIGTSARSYGDLRAPAFQNESAGIIKRTAITERVLVTFRAEFFNLFNRVVFAAPAGNASNANFGRIGAQGNTPRQGQLALRLDF